MQWEEHGCGKACQVVGRRGRQEGRAGGGEDDGGVLVVIMGKQWVVKMLALVSMLKISVLALVVIVGRIILVDFGLVDGGDVVGDVEDDGKTALW